MYPTTPYAPCLQAVWERLGGIFVVTCSLTFEGTGVSVPDSAQSVD